MGYISEIVNEVTPHQLQRTTVTIVSDCTVRDDFILSLYELYKNRTSLYGVSIVYNLPNRTRFGIKKIILHDPATIIIWVDGTKTVVKCDEDDIYDPEKGIALCFMKKAMNNKSNYNNVFKEWIK